MFFLRTRGFTIIEIIIVLALIGIGTSFGLAMALSSVSQSSVIQERDLFVSLLLRGARAKAIANVAETGHGVYIDALCHRYIFFNGDSFSPPHTCDVHPREISYTNKSITIESEGGTMIVFAPLSGSVTVGAGTTTFTNDDAIQKITLRSVGQIDW